MDRRLMGAGMVKAVGTLIAAIFVGTAAHFLKDAWDDAKEQAEEAANPRERWTDKNRFED